MVFAMLSRATAFTPLARSGARAISSRTFRPSPLMFAEEGQAEVVLVGCGAPNRGMGWYHAIQMLEKQ